MPMFLPGPGPLLNPQELNIPEVVSGTTYDKFGDITAGTTLAGVDNEEWVEAGSLTTRAISSGADVAEHVETGSLTTRALSSGADSFQPAETGSLTARALSSGRRRVHRPASRNDSSRDCSLWRFAVHPGGPGHLHQGRGAHCRHAASRRRRVRSRRGRIADGRHPAESL